MNDVIKKITDFWMDSPFLEKFKKIGEWFEKEIKEESNGFEQIERAVSGK